MNALFDPLLPVNVNSLQINLKNAFLKKFLSILRWAILVVCVKD
jgi:hypothetical protein